MSVPNPVITKLIDGQDAVPDTWNPQYVQIEQNFSNVDSRLVSITTEMATARDSKPNLNARIDDIEGRVGTTEPSYQEALHFEVRRLMWLNQLAFTEIEKTKKMRVQQGELTIYNRGVVNGMTVTRSTTANRNLNLDGGQFFMNGRVYGIADRINEASVSSNTSSFTKTCVAYVRLNGNSIDFGCSDLGSGAPLDAVPLCTLTIPPNNTDSTDQHLANVTIDASIRRTETLFPTLFDHPARETVYLPIKLTDTTYHISLDIVSAVGGVVGSHHIIIDERANDSFRITLGHTADNVVIRYLVTLMNS
ncbi:conserved hypothetical protein [Gammaproteobacteria bacterium]